MNAQETDETKTENFHFVCVKTSSEKESYAHFLQARHHVYFNAWFLSQ